MDVVETMMHEERELLAQRREVSSNLFVTALGILLAMLALAILLFWIHFRLLERELAERERMEDNARRLSGRILQLQDEERRRFSRELHDSLGQLLAMAKMHLFELQEKNPHDDLLAQIDKLLDQSITETRTISHLLHPPAARRNRLGIGVSLVPGGIQRSAAASRFPWTSPKTLAGCRGPWSWRCFACSRNRSPTFTATPRASAPKFRSAMTPAAPPSKFAISARVWTSDTLRNFLRTGARVGVGLAGMRERVREQGGQLAVQSDITGTTITVTMPDAPVVDTSNQLEAAAPAD